MHLAPPDLRVRDRGHSDRLAHVSASAGVVGPLVGQADDRERETALIVTHLGQPRDDAVGLGTQPGCIDIGGLGIGGGIPGASLVECERCVVVAAVG